MQKDRVVVITGAAGGMGAVFVERFLGNGDTVIATDTKDEALEQLRGNGGADAKLFTAAVVNGSYFYKFIPPEISIRCPLIHFASSVQRNATTPPISSGNPTRPKAVRFAI